MTKTILYLAAFSALLAFAYLVLRVLVRRDYQRQGRLTLLSSTLELLIWLAYMAFPYIYNPPCWPYVWACESPMHSFIRFSGYLLIVHGAVLGFGSMAWLGLGRSFGGRVDGLYQPGPYKYTRNPQLLGGLLMVLGVGVLWPSWYALGWVGLWLGMSHLMMLSEEEHLGAVYGEEYIQYCERVPRYLLLSGGGRSAAIDLVLAYIAALASTTAALASIYWARYVWRSWVVVSGPPFWPLPGLSLVYWGVLGALGGLAALLTSWRFERYMLNVLWGAAGALAPLVYLGAWSIGPGVLVALVLFLLSAILLSLKNKSPIIPGLGMFLLWGLVNLALMYSFIRIDRLSR